ncbi:siderophore-iron reductase FhuF [Halomonas alkaliantarctica]|uniref:siderophore-iron reductase FhuF n=1 Tax=Halomonas alkaliantarctica TaxID=232346 RepID=UPI0004ABBF45|nr:siderophore-iron reductase FhuF [Halomonas alkaliantarctica]
MTQALRQHDRTLPLTLKDCYQGPLAHFTPPFIGDVAPSRAIKASRWQSAELLEQDIARHAERYPGGDLRAITSLWSKWHFSAMAIPTLAAHLLLNRDLPVGLDDVQVIVNDHGCTQGLWLPHEGKKFCTLDTNERFATLINQHWEPLIERLSAISGAAPRVFWSNAGGYVDYYVNALATHPLVNQGALTATRTLLTSRTLNGQRNPLFEPVRTYQPKDSEALKRVRKLCCLRYLLNDFEVCSNCPLEGCDRVARHR